MRTKPSVSAGEIFRVFLKLGCISFGGPVAHLGFFQEEFVRKRRWFSDEAYADIVALCQFLPGPSSSQIGFAIGLRQAGLAGAFAAWLGFTLPSAVLMIGFALGLALAGDISGAGWIIGLKLAAVVVVADAIWNMARALCPDVPRRLLALGCAALLTLLAAPLWQPVAIALGAGLGWLLFRGQMSVKPPAIGTKPEEGLTRGWPWLLLLAAFVLLLPVLAAQSPASGWLQVANGYFRAGLLVFGGGHVVLPLLESFTVGQGWIGRDTFLAGYGAAQALPGPLFAFSAFLGVLGSEGPGGVSGGLLALVAIFVPSWLLVLGVFPYWGRLCAKPAVQAALRGANAAVVGLLLAAFLNPIWPAAVKGAGALAFVLIAFGVFRFVRVPVWALVVVCAALGELLF